MLRLKRILRYPAGFDEKKKMSCHRVRPMVSASGPLVVDDDDDDDDDDDKEKEAPRTRPWWLLGMVGPVIVLGAMLLLKGNVTLANKLGLQRMRTQRLLKRTLWTLVGNATSADGLRSLEVIEGKHRGFLKGAPKGPLRRKLEKLDNVHIPGLRSQFETFLAGGVDLDEMWTSLNAKGTKVVDGCSLAIETFDWQQSVLRWSVVFSAEIKFKFLYSAT